MRGQGDRPSPHANHRLKRISVGSTAVGGRDGLLAKRFIYHSRRGNGAKHSRNLYPGECHLHDRTHPLQEEYW